MPSMRVCDTRTQRCPSHSSQAPPEGQGQASAYNETSAPAVDPDRLLGVLVQLEAAGVTDEASQRAASLLGKAVGMTSLLRGTAHHAQR